MSVQSLLRVGTPTDWDYTTQEVMKTELSRGSYYDVGYEAIKDLNVTRVVKTQNPYLWQCYQLNKLQYQAKGGHVEEKRLYHATAACNVDSILKDNLDWRRSWRTKFGQGVSFSPSPKYCNKYCNYQCGSSRALIVCKVLVRLAYPGSGNTLKPPSGFDTTTGNSGSVYVKYHDNEFYPEYVVYYDSFVTHRRRSFF